MIVNIKLEFANGQDLQRMIDLIWEIDCPLKNAECKKCAYHESCLKLKEIHNKLMGVIVNEE